MLMAGMAAWVLRYVLFAYGNAGPRMGMLWIGILLHGICYDFFFVTGQIYIDREALPALRGVAQGLMTFLTYGAGMFVGSWMSGAAVQHYTGPAGRHDWHAIWNISAVVAATVLILFAVTFREDERESVSQPEGDTRTATLLRGGQAHQASTGRSLSRTRESIFDCGRQPLVCRCQ
jgi:MFS family permease